MTDINRKTAYFALLDIEKNGAYSNLSINENINREKPKNHSFVREIVYGVVKNKKLLDFYVEPLVSSGLSKLKKQDIILLRMGAYQLLFMGSVPKYAAVNETVALAKIFAKGRDRFINGVLRTFSRNLENGVLPELPDRESNFTEYATIKYSIEPWIVRLWTDAYGREKTEEFLEASNRTPDLSIRVNVMKTTRYDLAEKLKKQGFTVEFSEVTDRGLVVRGSGLLDTEAFKSGEFAVQDQASILVSDVLSPAPGDFVIDVCAAPGGKTMAMAEMMKDEGKIIAMDLYEHKLPLIQNQAERNNVHIIEPLKHDSTTTIDDYAGKADLVLADVPCSGLGVLRRKPEIKYHSDDMDELLDRQRKILNASSAYVKNGGMLVYSTCTINPKENEEQIDLFIRNNETFEKVKVINCLPTEGTDGFFICKMKKVILD